MASTDRATQDRINRMIRFIEQEAHEKAEEIAVKADEEYHYEIGRLKEQQEKTFRDQYDRKEKKIAADKKIMLSTNKNKARLEVLRMKNVKIDEVFGEASSKIAEVVSKPSEYKTLMEKLLAQGLCQLLEDNVVAQCRASDMDLLKSVKDSACKEYTRLSKRTVNVIISDDSLPDTCIGGVKLLAQNGQFVVENTLDARLSQAREKILPSVRHMLFGSSESRTFFD
eukprot:UC4_evm7s335